METKEIAQYWAKIVQTMNDGLLLVGADGVIQMVNPALEKLLGYEAHELVGRPCTLLHCDACEGVLKPADRCWCSLFEYGMESRKRCLLTRKDGSYVHVIKNASVLRDGEGRPIGAVETITDITELDRLDQEVDRLSRQLEGTDSFHGIIGSSTLMQRLIHVVRRAAQSEAPVLINGESGTGKELVAQAIHLLGPRKEGPFVQLNCAALNESLLESELFGHVKGAFTGAYRHRMGRFEAASNGDIFLDEIGDIPLAIQVKLLRVLESKQVERVGDHQPIAVDVRIIAATNRNLEEMVRKGAFRDDLFFRINVIPIHIPPLRERPADIPQLIAAFVARLQTRTGKRINSVSPAAMAHLTGYEWPGNVRELKSALEYAFVLGDHGPIGLDQLPPHIMRTTGGITEGSGVMLLDGDPAEKTALVAALKQCGGNQSLAARLLGVSRGTVWNRMRKYAIDLRKDIIG